MTTGKCLRLVVQRTVRIIMPHFKISESFTYKKSFHMKKAVDEIGWNIMTSAKWLKSVVQRTVRNIMRHFKISKSLSYKKKNCYLVHCRKLFQSKGRERCVYDVNTISTPFLCSGQAVKLASVFFSRNIPCNLIRIGDDLFLDDWSQSFCGFHNIPVALFYGLLPAYNF